MPVYVAKDYDGYPIDVVLTQSEQLAHAYWHGKGVVAHSVSILSDNDLADHPTGVLPILSTRETEITPFGLTRPRKVIMVRKSHGPV